MLNTSLPLKQRQGQEVMVNMIHSRYLLASLLGTASSQSAVTTVDYDDMSDLDSDLEITQLT